MDNIFLLNMEKVYKNSFIEIVREKLEMKFGNDIEINYSDQVDWGLLRMLQDNKLDSYQLIYVNYKFWSGSGGIIREFNGKKIYQAGFRGFYISTHNSEPLNRGLGHRSLTHEYNTRYQILRAKKNRCQEIIMSFNEHNEKLFKITRDYHLPKVFGSGVWKTNNELQLFNGVPQWLISMTLK